jgi:ankyrin repeat protein
VDCIGTQVGTALRRAVENNHHAIVQLLLKAGASVSEKANGFTPLHYVEDVEIAQLLLDHQADIHAVCSNETKADMCRGNSVLHSVLHLEGPNPELIRFLIKNGAKINVVNDAGESPIHTMVMATRQTAENFSRNLSILINAGANPYLEDIKGRTPLGLAQLVRSPWVTLLEQGIEKYALNEAVKLLRKVQSHASFLSLFSFQQSASVSGLGESSRAVKRPKR